MSSVRYLNTILTLLVVVMALNLWTAWCAAPSMLPAARADGIPDSGAQNQQMIDQLKLLNHKVDDLSSLLGSGKLRVITTAADEKH